MIYFYTSNSFPQQHGNEAPYRHHFPEPSLYALTANILKSQLAHFKKVFREINGYSK